MELFDKINANRNITVFSCISLFFIYTFFNAWCCDDAYHIFSMSKNFVEGYSFSPLPDVRINVATCPLWAIVFTVFYYLFKEEYYTSIFLNLVFSWGAYIVFIRLIILKSNVLKSKKKLNLTIIISTILLCLSKSFISYTTSGLENSLLFFLSAVAIYLSLTNTIIDKKNFIFYSIVTGLILFTRIDAFIIFLPNFVYYFFIYEKNFSFLKNLLEKLMIVFFSFIPFIIWEFFSLIYYGSFVPNTALAKLNTGFPLYQYIERGIFYLFYSSNFDKLVVSVPVIFVSIYLFCSRKTITAILKKQCLLKKLTVVYYRYVVFNYCLGILFYITYVTYIGGDFMFGRHFTVIYFLSIILLSFSAIKNKIFYKKINRKKIIFVSLFFIFFICGASLLSKLSFSFTGGVDERKGYSPYTNIINVMKNGHDLIRTCDHRGIQWFYGDVSKYEYRLYDPLLSRLPANDQNNNWKIGHMIRNIPEGYLQTLSKGKNYISDVHLKEYYNILHFILSGPLFSFERLKEVINITLGKYNKLIDEYVKNGDNIEPPDYFGVCFNIEGIENSCNSK